MDPDYGYRGNAIFNFLGIKEGGNKRWTGIKKWRLFMTEIKKSRMSRGYPIS